MPLLSLHRTLLLLAFLRAAGKLHRISWPAAQHAEEQRVHAHFECQSVSFGFLDRMSFVDQLVCWPRRSISYGLLEVIATETFLNGRAT